MYSRYRVSTNIIYIKGIIVNISRANNYNYVKFFVIYPKRLDPFFSTIAVPYLILNSIIGYLLYFRKKMKKKNFFFGAGQFAGEDMGEVSGYN